MLFDPIQAASEEQWLLTELGSYLFSRQERLIMDLVAPATGETLLDVGCGTGNFLRVFQKARCVLTGIESSADALALARHKLGESCELVQGTADELPFSDNEFDVVTLINDLDTHDNPALVIAEAIRVSRNRVFIGFFNKHSLVGTAQSIRQLFGFPVNSTVRFFSIGEMQSIIHKSMATPSITWGSVVYFPRPVYSFFSELEEIFPIKKNPLGAFAGMIFPVRYTYRTAQNPIMNSFEMKAKAQSTAPEAIRGMLRQGDR